MKISKNTKVLILSHGYVDVEKGGGPPQDIRDNLLRNVNKIHFVVHPFPHAKFHKSYISTYINGVLKRKVKSHYIKGPEWFQYLQHFFITLFFLLREGETYDVCFALDDLSFISVLIFRKIKKIKRLIYYSIDYSPQRFKSRFLNYTYHFADKVACRQSDINWVVAKHMIKARKNNGVLVNKCSPFIEVPIGFHKKNIIFQPVKNIDRFHLVFVGILLKKQGLQLVIKTLPKIVKKFPKVKLTIIGTGSYEKRLKSLVKREKITKIVTFKGFVKNHRDVEKILTKAGIGLAPYKPEPSSFTYHADPGKIKLYLGCGLPIIVTGVPEISKTLKKNNAGVIINYNEKSLFEGVKKLLSNKNVHTSFRNSAIELSEKYDVEKILKRAITKIP